MKNIKEEIRKRNTFRKFQHHVLYQKGFEDGVAFAHSWISVKDELPNKISTRIKQTNGNTFIKYTSYIVKGYFDNTGKPEAVKIAWFRPCVTKWDFRFDANQYEAKFIITHWREIEIT